MKKIIWQVLTVALVVGAGSTVRAADPEQSVPVKDANYTTNQSTHTTGVKHNRRRRRAEGTNRSSRPGTTTGVHAIEGSDTPGQMGTPSPNTGAPTNTAPVNTAPMDTTTK